MLIVGGSAYTAIFAVSGGTGPYSWSTFPALPGGLTFTPGASPFSSATLTGLISAAAGTYPIGITATDSTGASTSFFFKLVVVGPPAINALAAPATIYVGTSVSYQIAASGGIPPYTFSQTGNVIGMSINSTTGIVSGNPLVAGVKNPVYKITDSIGETATVTQAITASSTMTLINPNFPALATTGQTYSGGITLAGSHTGTLTPSVNSGAIPPGTALAYNATTRMVTLTGNPTTAGTYTFVVKATSAGTGGSALSGSITIVISAYGGARFYNTLLPSMAALATTSITALRVENWRIYKAEIHDTLNGQAPTASFEIRNPGASGLMNSVGQWMLFWQETSPGVMRVLSFGKLLGMPDGFAGLGGYTTVDIECRPDDWEVQLLSLCSTYQLAGVQDNGLINFQMDGLIYDPDRGPSLSDFADATIMIPCFNRTTLVPVMMPAVAWVDVDPTRPAGNFNSTYAGTVYDLTDIVSDFDIKRSQNNPLYAMTTKMSVAWEQRWNQFLDITGQVILNAWSDVGGLGGAGLGRATFNPDPLISSCPTKGSSAGTGWEFLTAVTAVTYGSNTYERPTSETAVAAAIAAGGEVISPSGTATITCDWGFVQPFQWVVYGDYRQRRNESITIASTLDLQPSAISATQPLLGANVNIDDPTVDPNGTPWQPFTTYSYADVVWYGGDREYCTVPHTSTASFDPTKWVTFSTESADLSGTVPVPWTAGMTTTAGELVTNGNIIYVANNTGPTNPGFLPNDFSPAPIEYILPWYEFNEYPVGASVRVSGQVYYCITTHYAETTWAADSVYWIPGNAPVLPMTPSSAVYFGGDRGAVSIAHQGTRHFSKLLKQSKCLSATFRVPYGASIGGGLQTADLYPGMPIRIRSPLVLGGVSEVIGAIDDMKLTFDGATGVPMIAVTLGLVPGNGVSNWVANVSTMLPAVPSSGYTFETPLQPIAVNLLGSPPYVVLNASTTGNSFASVDASISAAVAASTDQNSLQGAVSALMDANPPTSKIQLRPLIQVDLVALHHPTLTTQILAAPKNIVLA